MTAAAKLSGLIDPSTGKVLDASAPSGSVIQVVNATYATQTSNNTGSYIDTGLTASITPTSSSNKILILVSQNGLYKGSSATNVLGKIKLLRNSTDLIMFGNEIGEGFPNAGGLGGVSCGYLDSPATTSSVTYKTQFQNFSNVFYVQISSSVSTITLLEIAA